MKKTYSPLRFESLSLPQQPSLKGSIALFGELFQRGYAHGLIEEAQRSGYNIHYGTVGRREKETLRALTNEELSQKEPHLINIPLECGFDLHEGLNGHRLVDSLKDIKLSEWLNAKLDFSLIHDLKQHAENEFRARVRLYLSDLSQRTEDDDDLLIAHLMAGGIPRAKILMPLLNKMFKGTGERYLSSQLFWESDLGRACALSFEAVTADSFRILIEEALPLVDARKKRGQSTRFTAYGYHGTAVRLKGELQWQTYSPYLQGWAKMKLEQISQKFFSEGISCCVYNCPEILTQSSSVFQGVEVPLYTLIESIQTAADIHGKTEKWRLLEKICRSKLKEEVSLETIQKTCETFLLDPRWAYQLNFDNFPTHSEAAQLESLIKTSDQLISFHRDEKDLLTYPLSEMVFQACGQALFTDSQKPQAPVRWINHDYVSSYFVQKS